MSIEEKGYTLVRPEEQCWRRSNIMKIPNTNLLEQLRGTEHMGGRLWRLPPYSANTWHKHIDQWEFYFVLEGTGRMRIGGETITVPRYGSVLVAPQMLRQVFNDSPEEVLWLIVGAPQEGRSGAPIETKDLYPEDPASLPSELEGKTWPPRE